MAYEALAHDGQLTVVGGHIAQMQLDVGLQRDGGERAAVGDAHENAARHRVAVDGHDELGKRRAVGAGHLLGARHLRQGLLEKRDGGIGTLVEVHIGEISQLLEAQALRVHEGMACRKGYQGRGDGQLVEGQSGLGQSGVQRVLGRRGLHDDAQLGSTRGHIVDDALGRAIQKRIGIGVAAGRQDGVGEGLHVEQVVLSRNGEIVRGHTGSLLRWDLFE